jgi:hypothetical protein
MRFGCSGQAFENRRVIWELHNDFYAVEIAPLATSRLPMKTTESLNS